MTRIASLNAGRPRSLVALLFGAAAALAIVTLIAAGQASAQQAATPDEVATDYDAPTLSATAHSNGVHLSWTFDESTSTPPGWSLFGFKIERTISGTLTTVGGLLASNRNYSDPLTGVPEEQRFPGQKYSYTINALYERDSDNETQEGKASQTLEFTAPDLPNVLNPQNTFWPYTRYGQNFVVNNFTWSLPHLAWSSSTGFDEIEKIIINSKSHSVLVSGTSTWTQISSTEEETAGQCAFTFTIRARYGLFFSALATVDGGGTMC